MTTDLPLAHRYADFAASLALDDVPQTVREKVLTHLLDTLAVAHAGRTTDAAQAVEGLVLDMGGKAEASLLGAGLRLPMANAALANGTSAHALDYDDSHRPSVMHPSASLVPAALAVAEHTKSSGRELLEALVVGYEVLLRLGNSQVDPVAGQSVMFENGLHTTSVVGTVGSAVAAARLLGLDTAGIAHALTISCSFGSGILEANRVGGSVKRVHCGWAAHAGVTAALLARSGLTGPPTALEGRFGLFHAYTQGRCDPEAGSTGLGSHWESLALAVKPYPCNGFTHAVADAATALRERGVTAGQLASVEIGTAASTLRTIGEPADDKRRPANGYHAKFSAPYVFASALLSGAGDAPVTLADFDEAAVSDPARLRVAGLCTVVADETCTRIFPRHAPARVRAVTLDGREHHVEVLTNRGSPADPLTREQVEAKARTLYPGDLAVLARSVFGLEEAATVEGLVG